MSLEPRLSILRQGGILSDENYKRVKDIISFLQQEHNIELTEANAAAFITHICAAFERISRGESVEALHADIYEATKEEPTFEQGLQISRDIQSRYPILPEEEVKFIAMHMGVLLAAI